MALPPASNPASRPAAWREALDARTALMGAVLLVLWGAFHALTGGLFLTPENLYNLFQQTAVVGIMATVFVLVIVARHIDLSVGSAVGFVGVLIAFLIYTKQWSWPMAVAAGLGLALAIAVYQGALSAWLGVPSFVVTLGGLMSFRGAAFLVADGKTQPIADPVFLALGGGYGGAVGPLVSWLLGAAVCVALVAALAWQRRYRARFGAPPQPLVADALRVGLPCLLVLGFVATMNAYQIPGKDTAQGVPIPVLIWGAVALLISFLVHRTRFGRYIFAMGGNPDAAELSGINTRFMTVKIFALMGLRQLYFLIGGLLERLIYLSYGLAFLLGFIGVKLVFHAMHVNELPFINGGAGIHWAPEIPIWLSLAVIIGTLAITTILSLRASASMSDQERDQRTGPRRDWEED